MKEYSPEARRFSLALLVATVEASKAHPGDLDGTREAATEARGLLVSRLIDTHGYERARTIVEDGVALTADVVIKLAEHWGLPVPEPAA